MIALAASVYAYPAIPHDGFWGGVLGIVIGVSFTNAFYSDWKEAK